MLPLPDSAPAPSWVDPGPGQGRGYDLLGLRLPAQARSNTLLDGVTTVTKTVRYLSIQAWLAHRYAQAGRPGAEEPFYNFAAGAEAAVAFGNLLNEYDREGVIGAFKARALIRSDEDPLPLHPLVDQIGARIYAGPSSQLLLQQDDDSPVPRLTRERGFPLAEALASAVSSCELGRLLNAGECPVEATREELAELGRLVDVGDIPGPEADLISVALIPERPHPEEVPRVATYAALLALAGSLGRVPVADDLLRAAAAPDAALPDVLRPGLDGWLEYLVRDCLAFCHEAAFHAVINALESRGGAAGPVDSAEVLGHLTGLTEEHAAALRKVELLEPGESPLALSFREVAARVKAATGGGDGGNAPRRWPGGIVELDLIAAAKAAGAGALALLPAAWLLALWRSGLDPQAGGAAGPDANPPFGWGRIGVREVIAPTVSAFLAEDYRYSDVMAALARRSVDQHLRVAWARWSQDPKRDVTRLLADGGRWSLRKRRFKAGRTDSRLNVSLAWLRQLRLIDAGGLTAGGSAALGRALSSLEEVGDEQPA